VPWSGWPGMAASAVALPRAVVVRANSSRDVTLHRLDLITVLVFPVGWLHRNKAVPRTAGQTGDRTPPSGKAPRTLESRETRTCCPSPPTCESAHKTSRAGGHYSAVFGLARCYATNNEVLRRC